MKCGNCENEIMAERITSIQPLIEKIPALYRGLIEMGLNEVLKMAKITPAELEMINFGLCDSCRILIVQLPPKKESNLIPNSPE